MLTQETLLTLKDAAERLKVHVATVRREIKRGNLTCSRLGQDGRLIRFRESDLETYLSRNSTGEAQSTPNGKEKAVR